MSFLNQDNIQDFYLDYIEKLQFIKEKLNRPLTYAEKIIFTHFAKEEFESSHSTGLQTSFIHESKYSALNGREYFDVQRGKSSIPLQVDRVAMQDATAQMAILQFMLTDHCALRSPNYREARRAAGFNGSKSSK